MEYSHRQAAHCESGVISNLLSNNGFQISEPMAFGLSGSLAFAYIPMVKLSGMPLIAYRMPPKSIIKGLQKSLDFRMRFKKFSNPKSGELALNKKLDEGKLVGLQTSVFWLPYFPEDMRFHFNAHNLLVTGRGEGGDYQVSDPVFEHAVSVDSESLSKARFAKGAMAAKGLMYYLEDMPTEVDYQEVIAKAIKKNFRIMNKAPLPIIGIRGIRYMAKKIESLAIKKDFRYMRLYLAHIVRMQEEIGTGGAGFRFLYASFLQEAGQLLSSQLLLEASQMMTEAGDCWREFALKAALFGRDKERKNDVAEIVEHLRRCATMEEAVWKKLKLAF